MPPNTFGSDGLIKFKVSSAKCEMLAHHFDRYKSQDWIVWGFSKKKWYYSLSAASEFSRAKRVLRIIFWEHACTT